MFLKRKNICFQGIETNVISKYSDFFVYYKHEWVKFNFEIPEGSFDREDICFRGIETNAHQNTSIQIRAVTSINVLNFSLKFLSVLLIGKIFMFSGHSESVFEWSLFVFSGR